MQLLKLDDQDLIPHHWKPVTVELSVSKNYQENDKGFACLQISPRLDRWLLLNENGTVRDGSSICTNSPDWSLRLNRPMLLLLRGAIDAALEVLK